MFTPEEYQLIDFGDGRRLESFGSVTLDRACPAAEDLRKTTPAAWSGIDARFLRMPGEKGLWKTARELPDRWTVQHDSIRLELKRTEFGHLGIFPEQAANWDWLAEQIQKSSRPLKVLNLFAYTGGSTLAAAAAGAEVTHIDSARNTVAWAKRNAELSGLADAPIRWIAEDATKFVTRELKRGNTYDAVILDPPSYGHGLKGQVWRVAEHLPPLLKMCGELTAKSRRFVLLTCHSPQYNTANLGGMVRNALRDTADGKISSDRLSIRSAAGEELPCGVCVRWEGSPEA